ncbi:undecaprenyl-diphosphate phosphatase [Fodinisporobacter ferrooxydans]|uniref:Undecaprenyl-diphosphatase n=1 Tax=Fodinisporobacter ferrooxydans TaxID=2901836 RepID=A0ABY4CMU4_9BACL|nr:undecaprenyl-diphosphate phosphatase [Alicyclobacillaceae bacterium MYW30-H2]
MSFLQVIVFAIVQGITELFPVSSVAHGIFVPTLFHWKDILKDPNFLPFVVMLHLGTATALFLYFLKDWIHFFQSPFRPDRQEDRKTFFLVIVGTIPAGLLGLLLEKKLAGLFSSGKVAAFFLIVNAFVLLYGDSLRRRRKRARYSGHGLELHQLSYGRAVLVGMCQALALIPGFSRSGVTIVGALMNGLSYDAAARFTFLLATPLIGAAALKEVPKLFHGSHGLLSSAILGGVLAGIAAYLSTAFLMKWFKQHEVQAMKPFAYYCFIVGIGIFLFSSL